MKKFGITVLLAAAMAAVSVAAPAAAATDDVQVMKPLVNVWPNPR